MHKIAIYAIGKKDDRCYESIYSELIKNSKKYANIKQTNIFNKKIHSAQSDPVRAKEAYSEALEPYFIRGGMNIALHPAGELLDTHAFAKLFESSSSFAFFIGGAYGFEEPFVKRCDMALSLSPLTMSHKIAKVVLLEQIFRALSIVHNHPYHK